ncbi:hypothetical protein [Inediibacterium massiliense]|uniref:hypothetical protein n=1 Tax=Inediibacterium massiliense TaxID=1658111 RepID=UPI0006B52F38|nr:hypothetical protein [Inediibacterium massiliense]
MENNIKYYVTYTTNPLTGWKVLGIIEEEKIYEKTKKIIQEIFTSSFIIILIGMMCIAYAKNVCKRFKWLFK